MSRSWTASQEEAMREHNKTLLVSAAAGSGKTSVLTERIIRRLTDRKHPADLSRMLVVTFTRAAAAELKSRIASALSAALAAHPGDRRLSNQLFLLGSAQISTIDSFFGKAVRANFDRLSIPASFRVTDGGELFSLKTEILDGIIEEFYRRYLPDTENATESADRDADRSVLSGICENPFATALDHLISNRSDGKLDETLLRFAESFSASPDGLETLKHYATLLSEETENDYFSTSYGKVLKERLLEAFREFSASLREFSELLAASDGDSYAKCAALLASDTDFCNAVADALEKEPYERVRNLVYGFLPGRFPSFRDKTVGVAAYQNWRGFLKKQVTEAQKYLRFSAEEIRGQMLETARLCKILYELLSEYSTRLLSEKKNRGVLEYDDIRSMLYRLLTNADGSPSPFAEKLAAEYDEIYIDEYQDVDFLQDRIFSLIGGNRRFMVGDIKQSIYGFRGSEPSIFSGYRSLFPLSSDSHSDTSDGVCVFMSENFRCDSPVIRFTNQVCSFLFSACEKSVGYRPQDDLICSKPSPETLSSGHPLPVEVTVFDAKPSAKKAPAEAVELPAEESADDASDEIRWVAERVENLLSDGILDSGKRILPEDIAILTRTNETDRMFAAELKKRGIPVLVQGGNPLLENPLLTELMNLLYAIDNPYRDLPLSEFLLSPIGDFSLEELSLIRSASSKDTSLYTALCAFAESESEDPALTKKVTDLLTFLDVQRDSAMMQSADRFLRSLFLEERLLPYRDSPVLLFVYESARTYRRSSFCNLYGFLTYFSGLLESGNVSAGGFEKAESAVTVMTVHGSKGLEFPVVFLCACGAPFRQRESRKTPIWHRGIGCAAKLYDPLTGISSATALHDAVCMQAEEEQTEESIRVLYVALTRAREQLFVTGTLSKKRDSAIADAAGIRRGKRREILDGGSLLEWILASLNEPSAKAPDFPCRVSFLSYGSVAGVAPAEAVSNEEKLPSAEVRPPDRTDLDFASYSNAEKNFCYPQAGLIGLPAKAAASRLEKGFLDVCLAEAEEDSLELQLRMMESSAPVFDTILSDKQSVSAADIGTATHTFLQFCDFARLASDGMDAEAERMIAEKRMTAEAVSMIHRKQIRLFCNSTLMQLLLSAKEVRREQKFGIFLPMRSFTESQSLKETLGEQKLFVQGSMDLLLETENGSRILVDYKTDAVPEKIRTDPVSLEAFFREKHGMQLSCYATAMQRLFGVAPEKSFIYSLPLGKLILIPAPLLG